MSNARALAPVVHLPTAAKSRVKNPRVKRSTSIPYLPAVRFGLRVKEKLAPKVDAPGTQPDEVHRAEMILWCEQERFSLMQYELRLRAGGEI